METPDLDFEIEMAREQWQVLARAAAGLDREKAGFDWDEAHPDEVRLFLRDSDVPGSWRDWVSSPETYGPPLRYVARILFNDGRPMARLEPDPVPERPAVSEEDESRMQRELEDWVRHKWHELFERAGLRQDRGHRAQL